MKVSELLDAIEAIKLKDDANHVLVLKSEIAIMDPDLQAMSQNLCKDIKKVDWYDGVLYIELVK